jgi:undecaprenyl-diphosphatase
VSLLDAFILGLVQGVTEFLPVSSSGHLALAENLLGLRQAGGLTGIFLDVTVHLATLAAILVAFREPIARLVRGLLARDPRAWKDLGLYAVASLPAAVVGIAVKDSIDVLYRSLPFLGVAFALMGALLWYTRGRMTGTGERPGLLGAIAIGLGQAAAIAPAVSRSGTTIAVGILGGMDPVRAAEFSFLLGVPAIAGAGLLEARDAAQGFAQVGGPAFAVALLTAFLSGLAAIALLRRLLRARSFHRFAPYLWLLGTATLVVWALRH